MKTSSGISQLSSFSAIPKRFRLAKRSNPHHHLRTQLPIVTISDRHAIKPSSSGCKSAVKYTVKASKSDNDILEKPNSNIEHVNGEEIAEPVENVVVEPKRAAKIHDFCFGIPYGGIVFSGGVVGFLFSRNLTTLISGGLYGGALLALSILSLKVWGQGHSSLMFILGQAGIAAALLWKNMQTYSLTKKIFPTGFSVVISAAMLCFYAYVVMSGGNPPSKKPRPGLQISFCSSS